MIVKLFKPNLPNWLPWRAPYKTDNFGYYNKPGWATKPPVPWGAKFRKDELNFAEEYFGQTRVRHAVQDDVFYPGYGNRGLYFKQLRISRRAPSVANASRYTPRSFRGLICWRCGLPGHLARNCRVYIR